VTAFVHLIESLRAAALGLSLAEMVELAIDRSGLKAHYQGERDGTERIENLNELVSAAARFAADDALLPEAQPPAATGATEADPRLAVLNDFLAHASLEAGEHQAPASHDALQLMTAHSAKGLEFHSVFVSGLEEGLFPHENSANEPDGLEEERRLMYVAMTRARRRLYLSYAQTRMLHGQTRYGIPSRFLDEVPEGLIRRLDATRTSSAPAGAPLTASSTSRWRVGQSVSHPKFGLGVIIGAEGRGADARVQVNFRDAGTKWLMLEYAPLTPA
jgi:DNA helicase-2/ATP-dependent DNA helicase PcrA